MTKKKIFSIMAVAFVLCLLLAGCQDIDKESDSASDGKGTTSEHIQTVVTIERDIKFASAEDKEAWRDPLLSLLQSDEFKPKDGAMSMGCINYDGKTVYYTGLFDINIDGIPELLLDFGGGSKGSCFYIVYDIMTGEKLGSFEGSHEDSLCVYFNKSTAKYETVGKFWWQNGVSNPFVHINKITVLPASSSGDRIHEEKYLFADYNIDLKGNCSEARYEINGESASFEMYLREAIAFDESYIKLYETGLKLIKQYDYETPAAIVDALLDTEQRFVKAFEDEGSGNT